MSFPGIQKEFDFLLCLRAQLLALCSGEGNHSHLLLNCGEKGAQPEIPFFSDIQGSLNTFLTN